MVGEVEFRAAVSDGDIAGWLHAGPPRSPNILLLHGGPGLSEYTADLAEELSTVATIARYQQRGLAPSLVGGPKRVEDHVADALAVLDALKWPDAIVAGHSWGGYLAMHVGVGHPQRVKALLILDPLGAAGDGGFAALGQNLTAHMSEVERQRLAELDAIEPPTEEVQLEWMRIAWRYYFGDPDSAPPVPEFRYGDSSDTWKSIAEHLEARTLEEQLPAFTKPFLLIHGERSPIPLVEAERTVALVPGAELVVHRGKGHLGWIEEPGFINREVERFISTIDSPSGSPVR
jgi:proline iminopeptidase